MKQLMRTGIGVGLILLLVAGCATTPVQSDFEGPVGQGDRLLASSIELTAPDEWKESPPYPALAEFEAGTEYQGVTAVEFQLGYGETAIAWNFSGFESGQPVSIASDINVDLFSTETYFQVSYLSGTVTAEEALDPRDEINAAVQYKWADNDPGVPDATNGWETIGHEVPADDEGNVSVVMILGRAADDPPIVFGYFTNPVAE